MTRLASADSFEVSDADDGDPESLREAVLDSNAVAGPNIITFSGLDAEERLQLDSPLANISSDLTIDGTLPGGLEIVGDGTQILTVDAGRNLELIDIDVEAGELLLGSAANLTFNVTDGTIVVDEVIGDAVVDAAGTIEKSGLGTLVLTGANTFTGETLISEGTLEVTTTSLSAEANISSDATLRFNQSSNASYAGVISGAGAFEKAGSSIVTLTGANTYTGGTTISGGTLEGDPLSIQGNVLIESGTTLNIIDSVGSTYTGTISGAGTLVKSGTGTLVLAPGSGANAWSQARIDSGGLQGNAAAISGDVEIVTSTILIVDEAGSGMLVGDLSGEGLFEKLGVGTVTLEGNNSGLTNSTAGAMTVTEGTLIGRTTSIPTNVFVAPAATLIFDQSSDDSYNSVISGGGDVVKRGSGLLTFSSGQVYTGTTTISAGRLDVFGGLASDTTIASGATLGGAGLIAGSVTNNGRIAPGPSIGTLEVDSITFAPGSVFEVDTDPSGSADLLTVTGDAFLSGGTLELSITSGTYPALPSTILTASTINGSLAFTDDFPLLDITVVTTSGSVTVAIAASGGSIESVATTSNQRAVGAALDIESATAGPDLTSVLQSFETLTTAEFGPALDSLSGETLTQFATVRFEHADRFDLAIHSRLRASSDSLDLVSRSGRSQKQSTWVLPEVSANAARSGAPRVAVWFEPYGVFGEIEGDGGESDVDYTLFGVAFGAETAPFADSAGALRDVRLGVALAYGNSDLDFSDRDGEGTADSYMSAVYGGWSNERFRVALSGRVTYSEMDSERTIRVGALLREAKADFDGLDIGTRLEVGGKWLETERVVLETYGSVDYAHLQRSSIRETGAASINLRIDREKLESLRVGLGTRLRTIVAIDRELWMLPEIRAEWHHQLLDRDRVVDASFAGATTGPGFKIRGVRLQRDSANVGVGWTVRSRSGFEAGLDYDLGIDADRLAHAIGLRVGTRW